MLEQIQRDLFAIGARLADPAHRIAARVTKAAVGAEDIARLEGWIDALEVGAAAAAAVHSRRRIAGRRSAPRRADDLPPRRASDGRASGPDAYEPELLIYVNRLSDLLFVMARAANHRAGAPELEW